MRRPLEKLDENAAPRRLVAKKDDAVASYEAMLGRIAVARRPEFVREARTCRAIARASQAQRLHAIVKGNSWMPAKYYALCELAAERGMPVACRKIDLIRALALSFDAENAAKAASEPHVRAPGLLEPNQDLAKTLMQARDGDVVQIGPGTWNMDPVCTAVAFPSYFQEMFAIDQPVVDPRDWTVSVDVVGLDATSRIVMPDEAKVRFSHVRFRNLTIEVSSLRVQDKSIVEFDQCKVVGRYGRGALIDVSGKAAVAVRHSSIEASFGHQAAFAVRPNAEMLFVEHSSIGTYDEACAVFVQGASQGDSYELPVAVFGNGVEVNGIVGLCTGPVSKNDLRELGKSVLDLDSGAFHYCHPLDLNCVRQARADFEEIVDEGLAVVARQPVDIEHVANLDAREDPLDALNGVLPLAIDVAACPTVCACRHSFDVYETALSKVGICQAERDSDGLGFRCVLGHVKTPIVAVVREPLTSHEVCPVCGSSNALVLIDENQDLLPGAHQHLLPKQLLVAYYEDTFALDLHLCPNGHIFGKVCEDEEPMDE